MVPLLQTILLKTPEQVPQHPKPTRSNRLLTRNNTKMGKAIGESTLRTMEALKGHKWWSVAELMSYLNLDESRVRNHIARHEKKFNIQSYMENRSKYFRISPDVPSR